MRNACRKDDSRGGIRQCANMLCGKWESFPREFAKCRRCRKAKYCGKECQSTAWSEGHRFWCSARDPDDEAGDHGESSRSRTNAANGTSGASVTSNATVTARAERRAERERDRQHRSHAAETRVLMELGGTVRTTNTPRTGTTPQRSATQDSTSTITPTATAAIPPANQGTSIWSPGILNLRRPRTRDDNTGNDQPESTRAIFDRAVQLVTPRRRAADANGTAVTSMDVELPPDVRRNVMQLLQAGRRNDRAETGTATAEDGEQSERDGDDAMVIG